MLSCREVAFVIPDEEWSLTQKFQLKFHLMICAKCRKLVKQFEVVEKGLTQLMNQAPVFSPELAHRIAQEYIAKSSHN